MITIADLKKLTAEFMMVTPKMADEWLTDYNRQIEKGENTNRRNNPDDVKRYRADMASGAWVPNNQGIAFDEHERLIDGQHRLWAIKESGATVPLLVVRGLPVEYNNGILVRTRDTIDFGHPRSVRGQWQMDGIAYSTLLASAIRLIALMCNDFVRIKMSMSQMNRVRDLFQRQVYGIINNLEKHSQLRGYIVAPIVLYRLINREKADAFAMQFNLLSNVPSGSPILAMAKYFMANKSTAGTESQKRAMRVVATAIHAYEHKQQLQIARPSETALEWLMQGNKNNVRKVREILNVE